MEKNSSTSSNSRWNPTREQVGMLESLYDQGVRTPSTQQIQQITSRLMVFGDIQGKNVFYWFQNHKARQRQKQKQNQNPKQESSAYYNHFLHKPPTTPRVFSPYHSPPPHDVCSLYYPQHKDICYYQQCPQLVAPSSMNHRGSSSPVFIDHNEQETLDLFPVHPTGILRGRNDSSNS